MLFSAVYNIDFLHGISDIGSVVFDPDNTEWGHVICVFFGDKEIELKSRRTNIDYVKLVYFQLRRL